MRRPTSCIRVACFVALLATPAQAASPRLRLGGDVDLEAFHTSDLFPGGLARESDDGVRLELRPEVTVRAAKGVRVRPWASWTAERYRAWPTRDVDRWEFGVDVRRGPFRLRGSGGFTNDELYYPSVTGDVVLDRRDWNLEARYEPAPGWLAEVTFRRELEDYIPTADERDDHRSTFRTLIERRFRGARLAASHAYRSTESVTDLYSYSQNALRLEGEAVVGAGFAARGLTEFSLRQYRTGQAFARNYSRQDDRWRAELTVGRHVIGPLVAELRGTWRQLESTRVVKNFTVRTAGLALTASR